MTDVKKGNPLYEQIYENLKLSILMGDFSPGERFVDSWIADKLKVSRSPVREAFRKLEQDGLLDNQDGITTIYQPNLQDVLELFQIRVGLEGVAAYWATKVITENQLQQLNTSLSDVQIAFKEKKIGDVVKLNTYFHEFIISICENHRLKRMMKNINSLTLLYRNAYFNKYFGNDDFLKEHHEILKAMASRSPELASQKMETHILNDMNYLKHQFSV